MVLVIAGDGPLGAAIQGALGWAGYGVAAAPPGDDDLFSKAVRSKALVYAPSASILDGVLDPAPDPDRARAVVGAAHAPGVEMIVAVVPAGQGYAAEEAVLRKEGKPYVIVRVPPLVEEVAEAIRADDARSLWAPRAGSARVAGAAAVAQAVAAALETEDQGRAVEIEGEVLDAATLLRRAAEAGAPGVRVRAVWPPLYRLIRPLWRLLRRRQPAAITLCERIAFAPQLAA